jgi:hypothetical protein
LGSVFLILLLIVFSFGIYSITQLLTLSTLRLTAETAKNQSAASGVACMNFEAVRFSLRCTHPAPNARAICTTDDDRLGLKGSRLDPRDFETILLWT